MRELGTDGRVAVGVLEEAHDLGKGLLRLVLSRHVAEGDAGLLALDLLGTRAPEPTAEAEAATEAHVVVVTHLLAEAPVEQPAAAKEDEQRHQVDQQVEPQLTTRVGNLGREVDLLLLEALDERGVVGELRGLVDLGVGALAGRELNLVLACGELDLLHLARVDHLEEGAVRHPGHLRIDDVGIQHGAQCDAHGDADDGVENQ